MSAQEIPINELKKAVALKYDGETTPALIAKGVNEEAEEIIRLAEEAGVPLCDNAALVDLLSRIELGEEIPHSLYTSVACILAFAYKMTYLK